jgi:hypothetical protein
VGTRAIEATLRLADHLASGHEQLAPNSPRSSTATDRLEAENQDNYRTPHTNRIHVVERFKMIEGGKTLQSVVTVEDPGAFNIAWSATQRWRRVSDRPMT